MFIFPLIYITSFIVALREVIKGNRSGVLIFLIFGLSLYTTAMSITFMLGFKILIPFMQSFKELLILAVLILNIVALKKRPRFHKIDYLIFAFFLITVLYAILPVGSQGFADKLSALKSLSFFVVVYFAGRLFDPQDIYINKYFNFLIILTIGAGVVLILELLMGRQLQTLTGYADYIYYYFNIEPSGDNGISTTFDSEGGFLRFASFFNNPLEHAVATLIALSVIAGLYTRDDNKLSINGIGLVALGATLLSIIFAISRSPLAGYGLIIYVYALVTKKKLITNTIHTVIALGTIYVTYLFVRFENNNNDLLEVLMNTIDFSNPSSIGHIAQWVEGITAIAHSPLGLGLGTSGRVAGSLGENIGGENQFIIIGVQVGTIALFIYIYTYILLIRTSLKWLPVLKGKERKVCMTILLIKIGFILPLLTGEVESSSYISYIEWFLTGLFISIIMQPRPAIQTEPVYVN